MIDFSPSDDQALMRDAVSHLAASRLSGRERELEAARELPEDLCHALHELGLPGIDVPETTGGHGLGLVARVLVEEKLAEAEPAAGFAAPGPGAFATALLELGSSEQQREWLAPLSGDDGAKRYGAVAWSEPAPNPDRPGFSTTAKNGSGGWTLDGHKAFVQNAGLADRYVVFAQVEPERGWDGIGAFVVGGDAKGLSVGERYDTLGLDAVRFASLKLEATPAAARLDAATDWLEALCTFFAKRSLVVAARAVGLSQRAFDMARVYCDERRAFGKPIGHFQAVAFNLADRLMDVEAARWMVWRAAWHWDAEKPTKLCLKETAQAAAFALEAAMRCADDCVSLHGGMGFIRDLLAEKLMRDAKQMALCSLTSGQLDQLAAALELDAPLEAALVLPTPESQAIFV